MKLAFNIPRVHHLNLTLRQVADIYLGRIEHWNEKSLQLLNPAIELPNARILPVNVYVNENSLFKPLCVLSSKFVSAAVQVNWGGG